MNDTGEPATGGGGHAHPAPLVAGMEVSGGTGWERDAAESVAHPTHDPSQHAHRPAMAMNPSLSDDDVRAWDRPMPGAGLHAKVLTVSDGVIAGTRQDASGAALVEALSDAGFTVDDRRVVADGRDSVATAMIAMCDGFSGVIVSTGGTGFAPRDQTPEGTKLVIGREAPGLAEAMRLISPLGRLSRGVVGIRGQAIICNTPGSPKGCVEQLQAIIDVLPHAIRLQPTSRDRPI